jgi:DNA-binding NarL/FixJ family response regulator
MWIDAVATVLESIAVSVVGRTNEAQEALTLVDQRHPDLLLAESRDVEGDLSGIELIEQARERVPTLRVIVLGASQEPADIDRAFAAGAVAYVFKTAHPDDVAAAIRQTFEHSIFLARARATGPANAPTNSGALPGDTAVTLTRREREILALVAEGHSNQALAKMLWVTEQTVKFHLSNLYRKLGVSNRTEASRWAHNHSLVAELGSTTTPP